MINPDGHLIEVGEATGALVTDPCRMSLFLSVSLRRWPVAGSSLLSFATARSGQGAAIGLSEGDGGVGAPWLWSFDQFG